MGAEGKVQLAAKMADITKRRLAHIAEPGFIFARVRGKNVGDMTLFFFYSRNSYVLEVATLGFLQGVCLCWPLCLSVTGLRLRT